MAYCTPDEVFALGLSAAAFVSRARPVQPADVDGPSGRIRLRAHGLADDDVVTFEVTSGGALPTGVSSFTPYQPTVVSFDLFHIGLTFAAVGSGWGVATDPLRRIVLHSEQVSAEIDEMLTGHAPPIVAGPSGYPRILVGLAARMTARAAVNSLQVENPAYRVAIDRLVAQEEFDKLLLEKWLDGKPLNVAPVDQTPDVADNGARVASGRPLDPDWMGRLP
jgi:hypothetical protein